MIEENVLDSASSYESTSTNNGNASASPQSCAISTVDLSCLEMVTVPTVVDDCNTDYSENQSTNSCEKKVAATSSKPLKPKPKAKAKVHSESQSVTMEDIHKAHLEVLAKESRKIDIEIENLLLARKKLTLEIEKLERRNSKS